MEKRYKVVTGFRIKKGSGEEIEDYVTCESPVTIKYNGEEIVTLLCTFEYLEELATGFLRSEGFIKSGNDIKNLTITEDGFIEVTGQRNSKIAKETFLKRYITTGCGKGTTFYHVSDAICKPVETELRINYDRIIYLMGQAQKRSKLFEFTGGVHSSAICNQDEIVFFREDIGRHNTIDKIIGRCLMDGIDTRDKIILTTGRISSEILVKTAKMGIPMLVSRSAPTDLAISMAEKLGVTIVGFTRNQRMTVYTYRERVLI